MPQRCRRVISGEVQIARHEVLREISAAEELQIHRQEGGVVDDVDVAKPVVELQAVQQHRPVRQAEDVVGQQVGVTVDDAPAGDTPGEEHGAAGDEVIHQSSDIGDGLRVQRAVAGGRVAGQLVEVLRPAGNHRIHPGLGVDGRPTFGVGVETRQHPRDGVQVPGDVRSAAHHGGQPALVGIATHDDHRFGCGAGCLEMAHPEIGVGGQAAVEGDLVGAGALPLSDAGEIEKVGDDGFLDLVGQVARQHHQPGVGLGDAGVQRGHMPPLRRRTCSILPGRAALNREYKYPWTAADLSLKLE